jgi:predicted RNA binding protein YcfA (HicA-like mRNA interferase family)
VPKFPVFSGKDVCRILSQNGFLQVRQRGSHIIMQKIIEDSTITVPIPDHKELRRGTLQAIIRQSGLSKEVFA